MCPVHHLLLEQDPDRHGRRCPWPGCDTFGAAVQQSLVPQLEDLFGKIRYEVNRGLDKVQIRAILPPDFSMPDFTRIYHLHDAKDFNMTETQYIEIQKKEMLKDLIERIKTQRKGVL